ncbi:MAG: DoxX family protein [Candidatus Kapabacteria bacterium]|nr:DoxX family protein [Candidatus Kapabacteria bacterium]
MNRFQDAGQFILRVGISALMMTHGWPKLQKLKSGGEIEFFDFMWMGPTVSLALAVVGEFFAPLLIMIGYKTRWAAALSAFTMGVAALYVHYGDSLGDKEPSLMYFFAFLAIMLMGAGKWAAERETKRQ